MTNQILLGLVECFNGGLSRAKSGSPIMHHAKIVVRNIHAINVAAMLSEVVSHALNEIEEIKRTIL